MSLHILLAVAVPGLACCEKAHWSTWSPLLQSSALGSSPATAGGEWQCREHSLCKRKYHFRLTSCLTGSDSTKLVYLYLIQYKQSSWILTSQTGGQSYSDTSPYEVSECSLGIFIPEYCAGFGRLAFLQRRNCGPPWSQCWSAGCAPWDVVGLPARVRRQSEDLRRHN